MDIAITDPNGLPLHSIVAMDGTGAYAVSYTPTTAGTHRVDIYFNSANVPGELLHSTFTETMVFSTEVVEISVSQ